MALHTIDSLSDLEIGPFNIPEPHRDDPVIAENQIDVTVLPGIAFDAFGWRLGWGGGFYDRFLSKSSGLSVGLAFELQVVNSLPTEMHDKQVKYIVTEKRVIATNQA
jgi:5-formyltetrahydrofolate cyclo-ligase